MQTIRKSKVITSDYTVLLYDVGKLFVNTDNNVTITIPTPADDYDIYIKNLGSGTVTVNKTNGIPVTTRANRLFDDNTGIEINPFDCYLISYVKELDVYFIL